MSAPAAPAGGRERSPLPTIFLIILVDILSLTIMIPLLPFYAQAFGASPLVATLLFTIFSAGQLVSGPILGNLSDRHGRRPLLIISQVGMLISLLVLALATDLWMLFVARTISGFTAGNLTIAQAYITDHTRPEQRTRAFGVIGIAFGFGFALGPAIGGILASHDPMATGKELTDALARPLYLAAGLSAISIVLTAITLKDTPPVAGAHDGAAPPGGRRLGVLEWSGYFQYFRRPALAPLLWQFLLFSIAFSLFITGFALFCERRFTWDGHPFGADEVGYVYAYSGVLGMLIQGGLLRRLSKTVGDATLVTVGFAMSVVGYALLGAAHGLALLLVSATASAFGHSFIRPALTARVTHVVERHEQGVVLGLTQSLQSLAAVVAPPVGGLLIEHRYLTEWALLAMAVVAIGLVSAQRSARSLPAATGPG